MAIVIDREKYLEQAPADWERTQIGDLFKFSSGKARPKDISKTRNNQYPYPVYGGNGILGYSKEYCFDNPYLILGRVGEYCGCAHMTEEKSWISDNALYSKDVLADIDFDYFKFFFNYFDLNRFSNKNGQPLITQGNIGSLVIAKPERLEQKQIAFVLNTIQKAIQKQDELINTTTALKKSLINKLFTEGTKGEPLKQTEVGMIPESWEVIPIGTVTRKTEQRDPSKKTPLEVFKYVDVSSVSNKTLSIISFNEVLGKDAPSRARKVIKKGDVIFATVRPTLQRIALVPENLDNEICSTGFCVLQPNDCVLSEFLYFFLQTQYVQNTVESLQKGASYPAITDGNLKDCLIPLPKEDEQRTIGTGLMWVQKKENYARIKRKTFLALFNTLLNELMTGAIRVNETDFNSKNTSLKTVTA